MQLAQSWTRVSYFGPDPHLGVDEWPVTRPDPAQGQYDGKQSPDF